MGAEEEARVKESGRKEGGRDRICRGFPSGAVNALYFFAGVCQNHYYCYALLPSYVAKASLLNIFPCILQGAFFAWKATAMGKNYINGKTFLEKR